VAVDDLADALFKRRFLAADDLKTRRLLRADADLATGEPFGRFLIVKDLGAGGMGRVVLAVDTLSGRRVALKLLLRSLPEDYLRFAREARLARELSHPHIVPILDAGETAGQPWIAFAYVEGPTLRDHAPPLAERVDVAIKVARALGHAHRCGVVHLDVKPENVLVDRDGEPKLTDFSLARHYGSETRPITREGVVAGTVWFMSPEQAGARGDLGPESDVFSLGATLYTYFTRVIPFPGSRIDDVLNKIETAAPAPPRQLEPAISQALEAVLLCALEKDPKNRYRNGDEMADDLERARDYREPKGFVAWLKRAFGLDGR
jgi:serine/threonine-protein kinase